MMRPRLLLLLAILATLVVSSVVLAIRSSKPVVSIPDERVPDYRPRYGTYFRLRLTSEPYDSAAAFGRSVVIEYPENIYELLRGLSLSALSSQRVEEWVRSAQTDIQALREIKDSRGRTWNSIDADSAQELYDFRTQRIPGSENTFDNLQCSIERTLWRRINAELHASGRKAMSSQTHLLHLLHKSPNYLNWHLMECIQPKQTPRESEK